MGKRSIGFSSLRNDAKYPFESVVIPELEKGGLRVTARTKAGLEDWVSAGGRLVVAGTAHGDGIKLINTIFGTKYARVAQVNHTSMRSMSGAKLFGKAPRKLPAVAHVWGVDGSSVPKVEQMYVYNRSVSVLSFMHGQGRVVFIGHDWTTKKRSLEWNKILQHAMLGKLASCGKGTHSPVAAPTQLPMFVKTEAPRKP